MTSLTEFVHDLKTHRSLCEAILTLSAKENSSLRAPGENSFAYESTAQRKKFLAQLTDSLNKIREHRTAWMRLEPSVRQGHPEIAELLRENQNLIMKILVLDRENEQALLRKGLVPPRQVPPANRQRPHFVSSLYQRNSAA
ncbi:MAG TPA: hypothetical protein VF773_01840 [Verrucomicrobiae bacterium]